VYVFPPTDKHNNIGEDRPVSPDTLYRAYKRVCTLVGVESAPHDARRTFITEYLRSGAGWRMPRRRRVMRGRRRRCGMRSRSAPGSDGISFAKWGMGGIDFRIKRLNSKRAKTGGSVLPFCLSTMTKREITKLFPNVSNTVPTIIPKYSLCKLNSRLVNSDIALVNVYAANF
jgi:hypothetical protein